MAIRYTQPQGYCGIDAKYAQGLQALVNPALGKRNLVTGGGYSSQSGLSVSRSGVVQINQAFASTLAQSVSVPAGSDFTAVIHLAGINQNTNNSGLFRSATGSDTFCLVKTGASGYRPWIRVNATDVYNASSGPQVPTGRPVTIVFSWRSGKGYEIAWDGAVQHSGASAVATPAFTFNVFGSQNGELIGDFSLFAFSTRAENAALLSANPWQIFKSSPNVALLKASAATGAALGVSAVTAPVVGSMAFKSQPAFALNATTAATQGAMSFGPASRVAVNATTGDTVGSMAFKAQPVFGVAATTGQTLGSMAFKAQPSLGVNAQTAPVVGSMAFGPSARLSVSATLAPTVGNMAFVAQPKFAVAAQTAPAVGSMAFGPSSRLTITGETAPAVGAMGFKSQPVLAVAAQTAPAVGAMAFAVSPQFGVLATLSPAVGLMAFLSGDIPNYSPGLFAVAVSRKVAFDCTIARTVNFKAEVVNRG